MRVLFCFLVFLGLFVGSGLCKQSNVNVPISSKYEDQKSWQPKVDSLLTAGDTVNFRDSSRSIDINVPFVGSFADSEKVWIFYKPTLGVMDSIFILCGGFHEVYIHTLYPRSAGKKLRFKLFREKN